MSNQKVKYKWWLISNNGADDFYSPFKTKREAMDAGKKLQEETFVFASGKGYGGKSADWCVVKAISKKNAERIMKKR